MRLLLLMLIFSCQNNKEISKNDFKNIKKEVINSEQDYISGLDSESPLKIVQELAKLYTSGKLSKESIENLDKQYSLDCYLDYCSILKKD